VYLMYLLNTTELLLHGVIASVGQFRNCLRSRRGVSPCFPEIWTGHMHLDPTFPGGVLMPEELN
jgi:hypothetical protein